MTKDLEELAEELAFERAARASLEDVARDRERFIAALAHDLRQPLTVIQMAAIMLKRQGTGAASGEIIERIAAAAAQAASVAAELLDLESVRLGAGVALRREPIDLGVVVSAVVDGLKLAHPDRALTLATDGALDGRWDPPRLSRIAQNLVENALAHGVAGGRVEVSCRRRDDVVVMEVRNDSPEIAAAMLDELFQPFRRSGEAGGMGLGLYIARELARSHGGDVTAAWSDGVARFTLALPVAEPQATWSKQRRHPRLPLENELEIGAGDERVFRARGCDVSAGGLSFYSEVSLAVSEEVRLSFQTEAATLSLTGTVRHVVPTHDRLRVGVEFPAALAPAEVDLLRRPRAPRR